MLGLLSYKSLGQMQQSRELLQQSLAAVPLRSPFRIYVEKSVAYLEAMILHYGSIRLAAQLLGSLMAVNFLPTTIVGRLRNRAASGNWHPTGLSWSRPMSRLGHSRRFRDVGCESALPPKNRHRQLDRPRPKRAKERHRRFRLK
jgi:hypothetical protein